MARVSFFVVLASWCNITYSSPFVANLIPTFLLGTSHFDSTPDQTYAISQVITDTLHYSQQHTQGSFGFNLKTSFDLDNFLIKKITLGPAFYYQRARFSAQVWELNDPEFYNYNARLSSNNYHFLAEGELYLPQIAHRLTPFLAIGLGFALNRLSYHDQALPGISKEGELHLNPCTTNQFIYELGTGIMITLTHRISASLRYVYLHNPGAFSSLSPFGNLQEPIKIELSSQAILFGISLTH